MVCLVFNSIQFPALNINKGMLNSIAKLARPQEPIQRERVSGDGETVTVCREFFYFRAARKPASQ
jgi:hypothetical protein